MPLISNLPNGGKGLLTISDYTGSASLNGININTSGSDTIFGLSSFVIISDYTTISLMSIPDTTIWIVK